MAFLRVGRKSWSAAPASNLGAGWGPALSGRRGGGQPEGCTTNDSLVVQALTYQDSFSQASACLAVGALIQKRQRGCHQESPEPVIRGRGRSLVIDGFHLIVLRSLHRWVLGLLGCLTAVAQTVVYTLPTGRPPRSSTWGRPTDCPC